MKKKSIKNLSILVASSMLLPTISYAATPEVSKSETVYVTKEAGKVQDQTVSVWLNGEDAIRVKDKSNLKDIKNLKTDETITPENGYINWNEEGEDVYYQGEMEGDLPVDVNITYYLDGQEVSLEELEGKSGHLKIVIDAVNKAKGENDIYSPYVVITEMSFDSDSVTDIKSDKGKIIKDGKNEIVTGVLTPGLKENFSAVVEGDKLDKLYDSLEMEMEVEEYEPADLYALTTNEFFQDDFNLSSLDDLKAGIDDLTENAAKLVDASNQLNEGAGKLNSGITELDQGAGQLSEGSAKILASFGEFSKAFAQIPDQVKPIAGAVEQLRAGSQKLDAGINQYTMGVGELNKNMPLFTKGAQDLLMGATQLDEGITQLHEATSLLKEKTSMIGGDPEGPDMTASFKDLQSGMADLSKGISPLSDGAAGLSGQLGSLEDRSRAMGDEILGLKDAIPTGAGNGDSVAAIKSEAAAIDGVIAELSAQNEDGSLSGAISNLQGIKASIYAEADGAKTGGVDSSELTSKIDALAANNEKITAGIGKAKGGAGELSSQLDKSQGKIAGATSSINDASAKMSEQLSNSHVTELQQSIAQLDEATGKIKQGSSALKEGTVKNQEGLDKLSASVGKLDSNSESLRAGSKSLSSGLGEFQEKSKALSSLGEVNEKAINPMYGGLRSLNDGILTLKKGTGELKTGSDTFVTSYGTFNSGLQEYKSRGIDELANKTQDVRRVSDILDEMSSLVKEHSSLSGSTEEVTTHSRIIQKIK